MADLDNGRLQGRGILVPPPPRRRHTDGQEPLLQPRRPPAAAGGRRRAGQHGQGDARPEGPQRRARAPDRARRRSPTTASSIAREIELSDQFKNMGAQLVREVANKTSDLTGDGTTTATLLAQAIVREGMRALDEGANPMLLRRGIEEATAARGRAPARAGAAGRRPRRPAPRRDDRRPRRTRSSARPSPRRSTASAPRASSRSRSPTLPGIRVEFVEGMLVENGMVSPYMVTRPARGWRRSSRTRTSS